MVPPRTVFRDIFQLQPGQRWSFDGKGQVQRETYLAFDVDHLGTIPSHSSHALTLVEESLSEATQRQLIADRPLGTFFSGGIDSPLVTALALRHQKQLRGFTFGIQNSSMDESSIASEYAEHLRLSLQIESSTEQSIHAMSSTHFRAFSEPIGDYSTLATFVITHLASQHFTILLSGDGGDELFWGYPRMLNSTRHRHWFALPKFSRRGLSGLLRKAGKSVSYGVLFPTLGSWYRSQHAHLKDVWVEKLLPGIPNTPEIDRLYTFNSRGKRKEEVLAWLRWNEFYGHMQRTLLKVDRMSMAHSLEVRVPFLDKQVLEASLRVAPQLKTPNDLKWPLKRLLEKQLQGGHVFEKKRGFSLPIHGLINSQYLGELRALAHEPTGLFAHEFAQGGLSQLISNFCGPNDVGDWGIWHLIALHQWSKKYGF
jgi:asparagine synthase (glutamine-hydrolysing)